MRIVKVLVRRRKREHVRTVRKRDSEYGQKPEATIYFFVLSLTEKMSFNLANNDHRFFRVLNLDDGATGESVVMEDVIEASINLVSPLSAGVGGNIDGAVTAEAFWVSGAGEEGSSLGMTGPALAAVGSSEFGLTPTISVESFVSGSEGRAAASTSNSPFSCSTTCVSS